MIKITIEQEDGRIEGIECEQYIVYGVIKKEDGVLFGAPIFKGSYPDLARIYLGLGRAIHESVFTKTKVEEGKE